MAVPSGKTPISFLQELCTKRGITPQYDLLANEGAVHEPVFIMRVTVGDIIATGKGTSKKKAKHAAAQSALNQILCMPNGVEIKPEGSAPEATQQSQPDSEELGAGNPVGELQEFTQKRLIKPPVYEFTTEQGPPHAREFVCVVKLGKFTEKATGRSKKSGKRAAAATMLMHIKNLMQDGEKTTNIEESDDEDEMPLSSSELRASYTALKEGKKKIPVPNPQQTKEIQKFYEKILKSDNKTMQKLKKQPLNAPSTNYCQMLQEIAEVQRFEVSYMDIAEMSASAQHQCLVHLTTLPIAVCHGTGNTVDEAHAQAAHNALQYLKIMTKS
ncbi:RISC-loading complex subunit tarbp2-like [Mizuhopecten yessoensis]|nr:RISC-loading complex subunit tarbp2-like [Mizuhopecten yessoensis]XP_021375212.1 RISC-loading complex subunit tarbp2-like [Mizuhopecten yessoensis]